MILRIFCLIYFPILSITLGLSGKGDEKALFLKGLAFGLAAIFIFYKFAESVIRGRKIFYLGPYYKLLYLYVVIYSVLYFLRASAGLSLIFSMGVLLIHAVFWHIVSLSEPYKMDNGKLLRDLILSLLLSEIILLVISIRYVGFSLASGMVHNIAEENVFIPGDLTVPFIALIILGYISCRLQGNIKTFNKFISVKNIIIVALIISQVLLLWFYARRGPIIAAGIVLFSIFSPKKSYRLVLMGLLVFPIMPFLWDYFSIILLKYSQNEIFNLIFTRNKIDELVTATYRVSDWTNAIEFMKDFKLEHLIGYGETPAILVTGYRSHMHNTFLTLFFETGYLSIFLLIFLCWKLLSKLLKCMSVSPTYKSVFLLNMFVIYIVLSGFESLLRSYTMFHLIFITTLLITIKYFNYSDNCQAEGRYTDRAQRLSTVT